MRSALTAPTFLSRRSVSCFVLQQTVRLRDKPTELIILLAKVYVYKCKLQGSLPVLSVFQTMLRSRYSIEIYV